MRCIIFLAMPVAVYASIQGLWRRSAPSWGVAGLFLIVPFVGLVAASEPRELLAPAAVFAIIWWAHSRLQTYQAHTNHLRQTRQKAVEDDLDARRRASDTHNDEQP